MLNELQKKYELELEKIVKEIKSQKAKRVLVQFPDGLKIYATEIVDYLEEKSNAEFFIWLGSCFGACDVPVGIEDLCTAQCTPNCGVKGQIDLIVQFGHNELMPGY